MIEEKIEALEIAHDDERAKKLELMRTNEHVRQAHLEVKLAVGKVRTNSVLSIEINDPQNPGRTKMLYDQTEIEDAIMEENKSKFMQNYDTPFLSEPLNNIVGPMGLSEAADDILRGTFIPPEDTDDDTKEVIRHMKMDPRIAANGPIRNGTTTFEFKKFWKRSREKISSSRSGIHNGHYVAAAQDDYLAKLTSQLSSLPWIMGTTINRWKTSVNVELEKKKGEKRLDKLRTIHLLEADFNTGTKLIYNQRMLTNARKFNLIPDSQYSRKGARAVDAVLFKRLFFDLLRLQKRPGAVVSNDLRSCYDRIPHNVGSIVCRRLGLNPPAIQTLFSTLHNMKHYVRTGYGDSQRFYEGNPGQPLQGTGQGNGSGPPMWIAISLILISIMSDFDVQAKCIAAISGLCLIFSVIMYVDDTDILITGEFEDTYEDILQKTQRITNKWCNILWSMGAAPRPEKCFWFPILFEGLENGNWRYKDINNEQNNLEMPDHNRQHKQIRRFDSDNAEEELLGIHLCPNGNGDEQLYTLELAVKDWIEKMKAKVISRTSARLALITSIMAKIRYSTDSSTFSREECDDLQKPIYKTMLPKIGLNKHLPLAFRYAPKSLQGLELPNIYTDQGIGQLQHFLRHIGVKSQDGDMIICNLEAVQIIIGTTIPFLNLPFIDYQNLLPECWMKSLWEFLSVHNIKINGPITTLETYRRNDRNIIEEVVKNHPNLDIDEFIIFNNCRLYLQVHCLSDITTGNGMRITDYALRGIQDQDRKSYLSWPRQHRPADRYWKIWRRVIRQVFTNNTYWSLQRPLGSWIRKSHQEFRWFCDEECDNLFFKTDDNLYRVYKRVDGPRLRQSNKYQFFNVSNRLPEYTEITTTYRTQNGNLRAEGSTPIIQEELEEETTSFQAYVDKQPEWIQDMFRYKNWHNDFSQITTSLQDGSLQAIADGSYKKVKNLATCAWVITTPSSSIEFEGAAQVPGNDDQLESYRAELYGILCIITFLDLVATYFNIKNGHVTIGCDNIEAGKNMIEYTRRHSPRVEHFDLLWIAWKIKQKGKLSFTYNHVKGHQDRTKRTLTRWENMNVRMDATAKQLMQFIINNPNNKQPTLQFGNEWELRCGETKVTGNVRKSVINHIHGRALKHFYVRSGKITTEGINIINWNAMGKAMKKLSQTDATWTTKFVSKFTATGRMMHRWNKWSHSRCPRCNHDNEDTYHVITCPNEEAQDLYQENIYKLDEWMDKYGTHPAVRYIIISTLQQCNTIKFSEAAEIFLDEDETNTAQLIRKASNDQDIIGYQNTIEGKISKTWESIQDEYYSITKEKSRSGLGWSTTLIKKLLFIIKDQWKHRNEVLHQQNTTKQSQKEIDQTKKEVEKEFEIGDDDILISDVGLFLLDLDETLELPIEDQKAWLKSVYIARKRADPTYRPPAPLRRYDG